MTAERGTPEWVAAFHAGVLMGEIKKMADELGARLAIGTVEGDTFPTLATLHNDAEGWSMTIEIGVS